MSRELEYSPPGNQKWFWYPKALNYSPWVCRLSDQWGFGHHLWPMSVVCYVDLIEGQYVWWVTVTDWKNKQSTKEGTASGPSVAIQQAQSFGETTLAQLMPDWVEKALSEGWRPPLGGL